MNLYGLAQAYPELIFDNDGYQKLDKAVMDRNREGVDRVESILKSKIWGFVSFQNFKPRKDGSLMARYQVYYDNERTFIGVAYTDISEIEAV